jgi:hypothetical protein
MATRDETRTATELATPRATGALWFGVLAGPFAWLWVELISYAMVHWACESDMRFAIQLLILFFLLVAIAGGITAWRMWHRTGAEWDDSAGGVPGRSRFMALGGMALSAIFSLAIIGQGYSSFVLTACQ